MNQPQFRIASASATGPTQLAITFGDGFSSAVDLSGVIVKHPTLSWLGNPKIFAKVAQGEFCRSIIFAGDDDLSLAADNLRALP